MRRYMTKQDKNELVIKLSNMKNTSMETALSYLDAEEWCLFEAAALLTADRKAGVQND